ncbi:MAG: SDR family oxidoreductase [Phycisphaerae bacterium]|nr:SDR family oxidoreductase [Phycisphaerales bacterium]
MRIFVTGATGYIGGRLVPRLLDAGHEVVCGVRDRRKLDARPWSNHPNLVVVKSDANDRVQLGENMCKCDAAYYLIHSMLAVGPKYRKHDRTLAENFARAASDAKVKRLIYLGGLGETGSGLSEHLKSRREVEVALKSTDVPVTVLRAAMIIGSGSASFEILRYLVARLPVMITPRWVSTECQPIAVRNVIHYLTECLNVPETVGQTLDVGGPDVLTYRALMQSMAQSLGLQKRIVIPVPVLTPRLSSLWIHLVTPINRRIARPLAEGLRNRVVCRNENAKRLMPQDLLSVKDAIDAALGKQASDQMETSWSDAGVMPGDPSWAGGKIYIDRRSIDIAATPRDVFRVLCQLGGENGYFSSPFLWRLRGLIDRLMGGPGLRRGRRSSDTIAYGDALDFWRVTGIEENRWLQLSAEMRLPGIAKLEFEIRGAANRSNNVTLVQTAKFSPRGILGRLYWLSVIPFHNIVFAGMLQGICDRTVETRTHGSPKNLHASKKLATVAPQTSPSPRP